MCLAAVATDVVPPILLTPTVGRAQGGSWLRASGAAVTACICHPRGAAAVAEGQRDLLLVSAVQPAFSGIFPTPGL